MAGTGGSVQGRRCRDQAQVSTGGHSSSLLNSAANPTLHVRKPALRKQTWSWLSW